VATGQEAWINTRTPVARRLLNHRFVSGEDL
jgi:hypothetical protein